MEICTLSIPVSSVRESTIEYKTTGSNISLEKLVMEQLIEGPRKSGLLATIPSETKLITITVVDGVCYVNLVSGTSLVPALFEK